MDYANPKFSRPSIRKTAKANFNRYRDMLSRIMTQEDLEQEYWLVWHKTVQCFKPELNYEFHAFLSVALKNRTINIVQRFMRRDSLTSYSLDQPVSGEEGLSLLETLSDATESVEDQIIARETREEMERKADPRLVKMLHILESDDPVVLSQIEAQSAKAAHGASMGFTVRASQEITVKMVQDITGYTRNIRYKMVEDAMRELQDE